MSRGVNKTISIGYVCADPEVKYSQEGTAFSTMRIAMNESYQKDGEKKESTEYITVVFFKRLAEIVGEYVKKGSKVYVEGKLQTRKWEKDGQTRYITEIVGREMQMLDRRNAPASQPALGPNEGFDDDIPF